MFVSKDDDIAMFLYVGGMLIQRTLKITSVAVCLLLMNGDSSKAASQEGNSCVEAD
jgi:hypothetical protein